MMPETDTELPPDVEAYLRLIEVAYELPPQKHVKQHKLSRPLRDAIRKGWAAAWSLMFDEPGRPLVSRLARHHREAIKWHWAARHRVCRMKVEIARIENDLSVGKITEAEADRRTENTKRRHRLRHMAYFPIWSRGHMKCVDGETEVLMADGTRKAIKDILPGDRVQSLHEVTGKIVERPVTSQWRSGTKHCIKVRTRSGRELVATPDHRIRTFEGWKTIGELVDGDRIASPRRTEQPKNCAAVTDEEVRLLAYFLAEGNTTASGASFAANITNSDSCIVDDAIRCAAALGFKGQKSRSAKYRVNFTDGIRPWLTTHGLDRKKATEKRLPAWCYQLPDDQVRTLVAALLDTDGFISKHSAGINLANEKLIDDVRHLCLQIGLLTKKYFLSRDGFSSWVLEFDHHNLDRLRELPLILKADKLNRLTGPDRYSLIDCYPQSVTTGLPKGLNRRLRREIGWKPCYASATVTRNKIQRALAVCTIPQWVWLEQADVFWDEVVIVTDVGPRMTYDIEVAETHNFIANGLVTHNSTIARRIAVMDALISMYYDVGGYCLYFSGTQDKTDKHALSIEKILRSKTIQQHAPLLAEAKRSEEGSRQLGWRATMFYTAAGYVYHFGSLQSGMAGGNIEDLRPTMMIPDDIDQRNAGPLVAENNLQALTNEILPMGASGTLTFWAQNYIDSMSCMYRIHVGQVRVLTNRKRSVPVPAIEGLQTEVRTVNGQPVDVITGGRPTWPYFGIEECQDELNRMGLAAFMRECQHAVEASNEGRVIRTYDDTVHAISESEFASVFGSPDAWKLWGKVVFNDWARTKTARHANVAGYIAVSSQNTRFPGATFIIPRSYPANTAAEDVAVDLLTLLEPEAKEGWSWRRIVNEALRRASSAAHFTTLKDRIDYERSQIKAVIPKYARPMLVTMRVAAGAMSHSEDTIRALYNDVFGFSFIPSNPGMTDAIEPIIQAFKVDYNAPHRFRPEQKGFTRTYIVCPDDQDQKPIERNGTLAFPPKPFPKALSPDDLHHSDLCRYQMVKWSWAEPLLSARGERIDVILKENDDFGQGFQMVWFKNLLSQIKLTEEEIGELRLPEEFRAETIEANRHKMTEDEHSRVLLTRQVKQVLPRILAPKQRPATGIGRFKKK